MKAKKILRIAGILLIILLLAIGGIIGYVVWFLPDIPVDESVKVEATPERLARGEYLANHVMACMDCHSTRDWTKFSGPVVPGTLGRGGEVFDQRMGFPGKFYAPNITPYHLKDWTDAEIYRAMTAGVSKDGRPLFPIMGYLTLGTLDKEDIYSIIAYIRTLPEISYTAPASKPDFPFSIILHTLPTVSKHTVRPEKAVTVEYGNYLVKASGCIDCHTPDKKGMIIPELAFSGGRSFPLPGGILSSANITPDPGTGIGTWTADAFLARFKSASYENYAATHVDSTSFNTLMPWTLYSGMDTTDLLAIYTYLKSVKPIEHKVVKFAPLTQ